MGRYKFIVEYDGTDFECGWQRQGNKRSVQSVIEAAAANMVGYPVAFCCSGRTDKNVHAIGQVLHADFNKPYPLRMLHHGLNFYLGPARCRVLSVEPVPNDFHARFSAKQKTYIYQINYSETQSVFNLNRSWWIPITVQLDLEKLQQSSTAFIGEHDFSSFRDSSCQAASPIRTIEQVTVEWNLDRIQLTFTARSFLHKQIRIMVGTLIDLARGRFDSIETILLAKNRGAAGQTAPGYGLFLKEVQY